MAKNEETVHYLWHLQAIGLLDCAGKVCRATNRWKNALDYSTAVKVAIIDNGLAESHPNLDEDSVQERIDFSTTSRGTRYPGTDGKYKQFPFENERICDLEKLLRPKDGPIYAHVSAELRDAIDRLINRVESKRADAPMPEPDDVPVRDPSYLFGAHGTACAGLVAGTTKGQEGGQADAQADNPRTLPYFGVDPKAKLIVISTLYNHEYWPVIMGLLYAYAAGAHVILMPRPVMDLEDTVSVATDKGVENVGFGTVPPPIGVDDLRTTRFTDPDSCEYRTLSFEKALFEHVLDKISEWIPVVVAAGNSGRNRLEYPASLVECKAPHLIVAGACTAYGTRASYSCHLDSDRDKNKGPTRHVLHAPSNDGEVVNNCYTRFDALTWRGRALLGPDNREYSPYPILALDIPGEFGYGEDDGKDLDTIGYQQGSDAPAHSERSLYAAFGGTSAAAAVTAGVVSLMQRVHQPNLTGKEAKALLWDQAQPFQNVVPSSSPAAAVEESTTPSYPPGSAMIDADAVLEALCVSDGDGSAGKKASKGKPAPG